jgi:hypothetical protein
VSCPTSRNCYVHGGEFDHGQWHNYVRATVNGGKAWAHRELPSDASSIDFPSATSGWAVGAEGAVYSTTDAGRTWSHVDTRAYDDLYDVSSCSPDVGYAVGLAGIVLRTTDAGATWGEVEERHDGGLHHVGQGQGPRAWDHDARALDATPQPFTRPRTRNLSPHEGGGVARAADRLDLDRLRAGADRGHLNSDPGLAPVVVLRGRLAAEVDLGSAALGAKP